MAKKTGPAKAAKQPKASAFKMPGVSPEDAAKLAGIVAALEKQHGAGIIQIMDGPPTVRNYAYQVPTGSIGLDIAIGPMRKMVDGRWRTGGIPGTITEAFGPEGSGKTTLMLTRIANYQAQGLRCAMLDMEHALDPHYAKKLGVDMTQLWWSQPANGEQCIDVAIQLLQSRMFNFVGVDSVAALVPKSELEGNSGDSAMGVQARLMSQFMRMVVPILGNGVQTELFLTNQIRYKVGRAAMFGNPETQPGGQALKYAANFRLDIRKGKSIVAGGGETEDEGNAQVVGQRMKVKVIKNKVSPPFRVAEFSLIYGAGIDAVEELFDLCKLNGVIEGDGWFTIGGKKYQGKQNAVAVLRSDQGLCYMLYDQLLIRNMAGLGLNPDGTALEGFTMTAMPTSHAQFEPPTEEDLEAMEGQDTTVTEEAAA
jgi:recombination protein RecA